LRGCSCTGTRCWGITLPDVRPGRRNAGSSTSTRPAAAAATALRLPTHYRDGAARQRFCGNSALQLGVDGFPPARIFGSCSQVCVRDGPQAVEGSARGALDLLPVRRLHELPGLVVHREPRRLGVRKLLPEQPLRHHAADHTVMCGVCVGQPSSGPGCRCIPCSLPSASTSTSVAAARRPT
jgi:hypothetical protein